MRRRRVMVIVLAVAALAGGCGEEPASRAQTETETEIGPEHIHGLGVNPADGSLMVATHYGLFRAAPGERRARRVGESHQDTMGFTVVGPDDFLGSGHPDARADLPPLLGLIRSRDAGRTWRPVSLLGEADFHVLRAAGARVYGFDATQGRLMVSGDGGRTWDERRAPEPLIDIVPSPADPNRVVASGPSGLFASRNAGRTWRPLSGGAPGLLSWTRKALVLVDGGGEVHRSADGGRTWAPGGGSIGGQPAALAAHGGELYAALHSNEVKVSRDGGATWTTRLSPS